LKDVTELSLKLFLSGWQVLIIVLNAKAMDAREVGVFINLSKESQCH